MTASWMQPRRSSPSAQEGPSFTNPKKMAKFQDIITIKSKDHRMLTSRVQGDDGKWTQFMTVHYRRKKK
jgi:hypothetical protein